MKIEGFNPDKVNPVSKVLDVRDNPNKERDRDRTKRKPKPKIPNPESDRYEKSI